MNLIYSKLNDTLNIAQFDCGDSKEHKTLNTFLKERALNHQKDMISTTLIAYDEDRVAGYITLLASELKVQKGKQDVFRENVSMKKNYGYEEYPALKIGRLAVDKEYQGKHIIGPYLFRLAIGIAQTVNKNIGVRFIVVDAKGIAVDWYKQKLNFRQLDTNDPLLSLL